MGRSEMGMEIDGKMPDDVCRDYLRMVCNRGNACKFKHPPHFANKHSNSSWNPQEARLNFCKNFCHDFQNTNCIRGEECKLIHCNGEDEETFSLTGFLPEYVLEIAIKKAIVPHLPGGIPVCRDYLYGECRRARSCRFRHLSQCVYKKELNILFGVESQSASDVPSYPKPKKLKQSFSPCSAFLDKPCVASNENLYIHSLCHRVYGDDVQEENEMLKAHVYELRKKISELETANEFLLEQNATLRTRKNARIMTIQPSTPTTLNVHPAPIVASAVPVSIANVTGPGPMAISTVAMTAQASGQQLVPVSCNATGQQIMAAVSTVTVAGQTGSPALLATALPVSSTASQLVPVSAVPVSLATVSMAQMHMPPVQTAATAATSLVSYPIMTQQILQTRFCK